MRVELERWIWPGAGGKQRQTAVRVMKKDESLPANAREVLDDAPLHDWEDDPKPAPPARVVKE